MAAISLSNATFYKAGEAGVSGVVGIEKHTARLVRYEFQSPASGASSISLRCTDWSLGGGTTPYWLTFYIGTDPNSHKNPTTDSPHTGYLKHTGNAYEGSADMILLPSTRYYVWIFPYDFQKYGWLYWPKGSKYATLTTAGAAATALSADNGILGKSHVLSLQRYSTTAAHDLRATCGSQSMTIASGIQTDSFTWTPPISWSEQNTTGSSVQVTITCDTRINGSVIGSVSVVVTMSIPDEIKPICQMTLTDPSGLLEELGTYVQGKSKVKVEAAGRGAYGSTIEAYQITVAESKTFQSSATFDLSSSGRIYIIAWAQDSRGRWGYSDTYISVAPYRIPKAEILNIYRCDSDGKDDAQGDHATIVFNASVDELIKSSARYAIKYRVRGGTIWSTQSLPEYDGIQNLSRSSAVIPADPGLAYECSVEAADRWAPARMSPYRTCPVAFMLLQIDKDRNAFGIGQQAGPDGTISCGFPVILNKSLMVGGIVARKLLRSDDDANMCTEPGIYGVTSNDDAARIRNLPVAVAGLLWTVNITGQDQITGSWVYEMQFYRPLHVSLPTYRRIMSTGAEPDVWSYGEWYPNSNQQLKEGDSR